MPVGNGTGGGIAQKRGLWRLVRGLSGAVNQVLEEGKEGGVAGFDEYLGVELDAEDAIAMRSVPLPGFDYTVRGGGDHVYAGAGFFDGLVVEGVHLYRIEAQQAVQAGIRVNVDPVGADGSGFALAMADGGMTLAYSGGTVVHGSFLSGLERGGSGESGTAAAVKNTAAVPGQSADLTWQILIE